MRRSFGRWFVNTFWYHYKWHVLIGLLSAALVAWMLADILSKVPPDFTYAVVAESYANEETFRELTAVFAERHGDADGNGKERYFPQVIAFDETSPNNYVNAQRLQTFFFQPELLLYIFTSFDIMYYEDGLFEDLAALGYAAPPDTPWAADVTLAPLLARAGLGEPCYLAIRALYGEDKTDEAKLRFHALSFDFLDMLLSAP
ncbi:MAG: hypothetical protein LBI44_02380 [Oscillospiraceae bacterium]|jgi:hypothetical protein|nr:hypothetical protein [Oscillospiraceae bacterium]